VDGPLEYTFVFPTALALSTGGALVVDSDYRQLRFFDAAGEWITTSGGEGAGPGEFIWLGPTFVLPGDTVVATDHAAGRVSIFDGRGHLVQTVGLESRGSQTVVVGPLDTWLWAATADFVAPDSAGLGGRRSEIAIYGADGTATAVIDTVTLFRMLTRGDGARRTRTVLPFGPRPSAVAADGRVYVSTGDTYEIRQYDRAGELRSIIRKDWEAPSVTDADVAALMNQTRRRLGRSSVSRTTRATLLEQTEEAARLSPTMPAIEELRTDRLDNLWVRRWTGRRAPPRDTPATPYDVFDRDGRWLGEVMIPAGYWVTDIGDDYVWTMWADEMEVNYARRLPLVKPLATHPER
jgi:hypothetical protein